MAKNSFIVAYDIAEDRRRTRVYNYLRGWGDHLQYSVFRVVLSRIELARLRAAIHDLVDHSADQVLLFDLGPADGRARGSVVSIGLDYTHPERHAVIV